MTWGAVITAVSSPACLSVSKDFINSSSLSKVSGTLATLIPSFTSLNTGIAPKPNNAVIPASFIDCPTIS